MQAPRAASWRSQLAPRSPPHCWRSTWDSELPSRHACSVGAQRVGLGRGCKWPVLADGSNLVALPPDYSVPPISHLGIFSKGSLTQAQTNHT
jgi:hypothetical protein